MRPIQLKIQSVRFFDKNQTYLKLSFLNKIITI